MHEKTRSIVNRGAQKSLHRGSRGPRDAGWEVGGIAQGVSKESSGTVRAVAEKAGG